MEGQGRVSAAAVGAPGRQGPADGSCPLSSPAAKRTGTRSRKQVTVRGTAHTEGCARARQGRAVHGQGRAGPGGDSPEKTGVFFCWVFGACRAGSGFKAGRRARCAASILPRSCSTALAVTAEVNPRAAVTALRGPCRWGSPCRPARPLLVQCTAPSATPHRVGARCWRGPGPALNPWLHMRVWDSLKLWGEGTSAQGQGGGRHECGSAYAERRACAVRRTRSR